MPRPKKPVASETGLNNIPGQTTTTKRRGRCAKLNPAPPTTQHTPGINLYQMLSQFGEFLVEAKTGAHTQQAIDTLLEIRDASTFALMRLGYRETSGYPGRTMAAGS